MSQHDYNVANAAGVVVRADVNSVLGAIVTLNSGGTAPSPTFANMWWYDTANNILYKRDNTNTAWLAVFDESSGVITSLIPSLFFPATGLGSGASVDMTDLPAGAREIILNIQSLSTTGTSPPILRLGDSGGFEATDYKSTTVAILSDGTSVSDATTVETGIQLSPSSAWAAAKVVTGILHLLHVGGNTWIAKGNLGTTGANIGYGVSVIGHKTLSGELDRLRLTTVGGIDTFDVGTWSALVRF